MNRELKQAHNSMFKFLVKWKSFLSLLINLIYPCWIKV